MFNLKTELKKHLQNIINKTYSKIDWLNFDFEITTPPDSKFGDLSANLIFKLAPIIKEDIKSISRKLLPIIEADKFIKTNFSKIELAGNGYLNLFFNDKILNNAVTFILKEKNKFSHSKILKGKKINLEFISANPTGPLHIGNGRGGFIGDVLANVFKKCGAKVTREYYINDQGGQIEKLGHSVLGDEQAVYHGEYIEDIKNNLRLITKDPYLIGEKAARIILNKLIKKTIEKMKIKFDKWFWESSLYHPQNKVKKIIDQLIKKKYIFQKAGAWWFKATEFGDEKDRVVIKSNGEYTYLASDFAYHQNKFQRGFNKLINIWGADHYGDIKRIKGAVEVLGHKGQLDVIITQMVHLLKDGQEVKMSKRTGNYLTIDEVINEVGHDNARFFFLMQSTDSHLNFDLNLAKEKNEKNPVYYGQYAYVRMNSIIAKVKKVKKINKQKLVAFQKEEREFIKELMNWPEILEEVATNYQIQKIPFYIIKLADKFHAFYEHCRVIEGDKVNLERLKLIKIATLVFKDVFEVLGVSSPKKM